MYLNTSVYSRTKAYLGAPTADLYVINDKVKVVAITDTDYYKLENGRFIHCDYLSSEKPLSGQRLPQHRRPKRPSLRQLQRQISRLR